MKIYQRIASRLHGNATLGFIRLRTVLFIVVAGWGLRWYLMPPAYHAPVEVGGGKSAALADCPLPQQVIAGEDPLQSAVPPGMKPFTIQIGTLEPLHGFSVNARVLSRTNYSTDREARLSPVDLALGWKRMSEPAVLSQLKISQSSRWYHYRWENEPPLPPAEIIRSSANMHMIPASASVAKMLERIDKDDLIRIDGWLVEAALPNGWRWRSSTTREDSGANACELVYVCAVTKL
jgi:hypothetical protein